MPVQSDEYKAVKAFVKTVSGITFSPHNFAFNLCLYPPVVVERVLDCFIAVIDNYSRMLDEGLYDHTNADLCVRAKRVQDALLDFR